MNTKKYIEHRKLVLTKLIYFVETKNKINISILRLKKELESWDRALLK